jgi:hypothetical protein
MILTRTIIKDSPEYRLTDQAGTEVARAHCVNVPANLFTLVINGRWAGVGPEAAVVAKLNQI